MSRHHRHHCCERDCCCEFENRCAPPVPVGGCCSPFGFPFLGGCGCFGGSWIWILVIVFLAFWWSGRGKCCY